MLTLKHISKQYVTGDSTVHALRDISLSFRKNEFVAVLGPSGCGKTTLLNIIGGLDRYTTGDLSIAGRSTKEYRDADWDTYRNNSIGFVFQSYNLIPHQTVLSNVELALTLSGVSKHERRARAIAVLEKVGLGDQLHKKPNQMSGGQMQRVAIARALVNDPEILLADEPTGALDSETSLQIMELLKEIAADRLVVMVTHNPDLADQYATRVVRLLDGSVVDDTMPYAGDAPQKKEKGRKKGKARMRFTTALSLSFKNLLTKKARTLLTAFAGSIGIIGIALILALSNGTTEYIARVEEDTLSSYPITIEQSATDLAGMMSSFMGLAVESEPAAEGTVEANTIMKDMLSSLSAQRDNNDLSSFKEFLEGDGDGIHAYLSDIQYSYATPLNIYNADAEGGPLQVNPSQIFTQLGMGTSDSAMGALAGTAMTDTIDVWARLTDNEELLDTQYDVLAGDLPTRWDEAVLIVDQDGHISDYTLYALGLLDPGELSEMMTAIAKGETFESEAVSYTYEELLGLTFKLMPATAYYEKTDAGWQDMRNDPVFMEQALDAAEELRIVGVLKVADDAASSATAFRGTVGYRSDLMSHLLEVVNNSDIVAEQLANPETDVFTGKPFAGSDTAAQQQFDLSALPPEQQAYLAGLSEEERNALMAQYAAQSTSEGTYEGNLTILGVADEEHPSLINLFPKDFEAKESVSDIIAAYNTRMEEAGEEGKRIQYTDYVGLMMSSVTTIINAITYILIAFVAISLVVSSIMIGIITYISVLERTKEIGILRSIGASKRDISNVFNAETLIVGFSSGALGIGVTVLLVLLANMIIESLTGLVNLAVLPVDAALILIGISMALSFIAGLIPSRVAAKKDPVVALRTE